eukprot:g6130.t1
MVSFQNRLKHLEAKHNLMHSKHTLKASKASLFDFARDPALLGEVGMQRARPVASNKEWNQHSENGGVVASCVLFGRSKDATRSKGHRY